MIPFATHLILPADGGPHAEGVAAEATTPALTQCSDDHLMAERVERALRATGYRVLCDVAVCVKAGTTVFLGGRVSSFYLKQIAQATALAVPGVHQVRNNLEVFRPNRKRP